MVSYDRRTTGTQLKRNKVFKSRAMRCRCLLPIVLLSIIMYGIFVYFSVLTNINDIRHLKTTDNLFEERIQQLEKKNNLSMKGIQQWQGRLEQLRGKSKSFNRSI